MFLVKSYFGISSGRLHLLCSHQGRVLSSGRIGKQVWQNIVVLFTHFYYGCVKHVGYHHIYLLDRKCLTQLSVFS